MRMRMFALTLFALAGLVGPARASITYQYVADASSYTLSAPGTQVVNLYLQETVTGSSTSLVAANQGLYGAGLSVALTGGSGSTITGTTANTAVFGSGSFATQGNTTTTAQILDQTGTSATTGAPMTAVSATVNKILLGTVTIAVNSGTSTFTLSKYPPPTLGGDTTTFSGNNGNGFDLDFTNNNGPTVTPQGGATYIGTTDTNGGLNPAFTFTTTVAVATPEPSSMLLCGLAVSGMGFGAWRRRKAKLQAQSVEATA